jgi:hypothetical protein
MKRLALILLLAVSTADAARLVKLSVRGGGRSHRYGRCLGMIGDGFMVSATDGSPYDAKSQWLARVEAKAAAPIRRSRRPWFSCS